MVKDKIIETTVKSNTVKLSSQIDLAKLEPYFYKEGYKISSWCTTQEQSQGGDIFLPETTINISSDMDIYAQWEYLGDLIFTSTNGNKSYFDSNDSEILSVLTYTNSNKTVQSPYNKDSNISAFDSVIAVEGNNITSINNQAFYRCENLLSINCPNVQSIGRDAFHNCYNLLSINIPNVYSIGYQSFYNCKNLTSINIPNVQNIGNQAFYYCSKLSNIYITETDDVPYLYYVSTFTGLPSNYTIWVKNQEVYNKFIIAYNWKEIKSHISVFNPIS